MGAHDAYMHHWLVRVKGRYGVALASFLVFPAPAFCTTVKKSCAGKTGNEAKVALHSSYVVRILQFNNSDTFNSDRGIEHLNLKEATTHYTRTDWCSLMGKLCPICFVQLYTHSTTLR